MSCPGLKSSDHHKSDRAGRGAIDFVATGFSHAATATDSVLFHRISSAHAIMESTTPRKFKSNLLAALDLTPSLDNIQNISPMLTRTKRKQTPGSPDPRQPKRIADAVRSNVPGLENILCGCFRTINITPDLI